jgi:hypothetical protein
VDQLRASKNGPQRSGSADYSFGKVAILVVVKVALLVESVPWDLLVANGGGLIVTYMLLIGKAVASNSNAMNAGNINTLTRLTAED